VKFSTVKIVLYLEAYMNFCLYFPHVLSKLGQIRCQRSAQNAVDHLWVPRNSASGRPCLYHGRKLNYI